MSPKLYQPYLIDSSCSPNPSYRTRKNESRRSSFGTERNCSSHCNVDGKRYACVDNLLLIHYVDDFQMGGTRSGDLSLRQQRMTLSMLNTLRTETVRINMSLLTFDELEVPHRNGKYHTQANEFVHLRIKIKNQYGK